MRFRFNERKAAQAAAYLISRHGGSLNYMVLIKLLYLADRETLLKIGLPITGDAMVSMPHGPVLSQVYDRINMGHRPDRPSQWFEYISEPRGYDVGLAKDSPETDELSRYELRILSEIDAKYGKMNKWSLRDLTHTLPEWEDPHGSSNPIPPERIFHVSGYEADEIHKLTENAEEIWFMQEMAKADF